MLGMDELRETSISSVSDCTGLTEIKSPLSLYSLMDSIAMCTPREIQSYHHLVLLTITSSNRDEPTWRNQHGVHVAQQDDSHSETHHHGSEHHLTQM